MKYRIIGILAISLLFNACSVAEKNITGTYHPAKDRRTRLMLRADHQFELALLNPATDSLLFPGKSPLNCFTTGTWQYKKKTLTLYANDIDTYKTGMVTNDSITHFTTISSFNFWNRYGDPVPIRYILLPMAKTKPHFGNSLYFFSQDFKEKDTLKFFFDGYPPFDFPGSIPSTIGNNMHKIVLAESYQPADFTKLQFVVRRNKLVSIQKRVKLRKKL